MSGGKFVPVALMKAAKARRRGLEDQRAWGTPDQRRKGQEEALALVSRGGAAKDGVAKCLLLIPAPGAVLGIEGAGPRGVGGEVALLGPQLVDTACYELAQAHEGVRSEGKRVRVVSRGGGHLLPVFKQEGSSLALKGAVGCFHGVGRREEGGVGEEVCVREGGPGQGAHQGERDIG